MSEQISTMPEKKQETHEKQKSSPKDVFLHLLMIGMLYASVFAFISLWFNYIDFLFPDTLNYYYQGILDSILFSTATLAVVFPIYLLLSWLLGKEMSLDPEKRELSVRKWLVYLTLFISAIAIIVDIVRLVYNFLSGELTVPFFLKIFIVLAVAIAVFGYYLWDVRRKTNGANLSSPASVIPKTLAQIVSFVVIGSIVAEFFLVGSPAHQRDIRLDNQRIGDLQNIQSRIVNYWQQKERLPEKLADLNDPVGGFVTPIDPDGASYEYAVKDSLTFDLCATFKTASVGADTTGRYTKPIPAGYFGDPFSQNWNHSAGRACFTRPIDPELYKINKTAPMPIPVQM